MFGQGWTRTTLSHGAKVGILVAVPIGPNHPNVAQSLENYAALLRETRRGAEADKMEARAKAIRDKRAKENK